MSQPEVDPPAAPDVAVRLGAAPLQDVPPPHTRLNAPHLQNYTGLIDFREGDPRHPHPALLFYTHMYRQTDSQPANNLVPRVHTEIHAAGAVRCQR